MTNSDLEVTLLEVLFICCFVRCVVFVTAVWLLQLSLVSLSFAGSLPNGDVTQPVNNRPIAMPPLANNTISNRNELLQQNVRKSYERIDGHLRDNFVSVSNPLYNRPGMHREDTLTRAEVDQSTSEPLANPDDIIGYDVMRDRVLAPTIIGG